MTLYDSPPNLTLIMNCWYLTKKKNIIGDMVKLSVSRLRHLLNIYKESFGCPFSDSNILMTEGFRHYRF